MFPLYFYLIYIFIFFRFIFSPRFEFTYKLLDLDFIFCIRIIIPEGFELTQSQCTLLEIFSLMSIKRYSKSWRAFSDHTKAALSWHRSSSLGEISEIFSRKHIKNLRLILWIWDWLLRRFVHTANELKIAKNTSEPQTLIVNDEYYLKIKLKL